jgi:hypothetical protein
VLTLASDSQFVTSSLEEMNKRLVTLCQTETSRDVILECVKITSDVVDYMIVKCPIPTDLPETIGKFAVLLRSKLSRNINIDSFISYVRTNISTSDPTQKETSMSTQSCTDLLTQITLSRTTAAKSRCIA